MSVRLQTKTTIICMAGFAVTRRELSGVPDGRAPHRRRRAVGTGACGDHPPYRPGDGFHRRRLMDSLWVRARLAAREQQGA